MTLEEKLAEIEHDYGYQPVRKLIVALRKACQQRDAWANEDITRSKLPYILADESQELLKILEG